MKFGIIPINIAARPERVVEVARRAEAMGVESVWTFEHVVVPLDYHSRYPYHPGGKMPATPPETPFLDPFLTLAWIGAGTERLRLGTGVAILPQANPLYFAKQAATLDVLSGGRVVLGVGAGWLREEYQALGVPFEDRGARFDDYLAAIKQVWSGEVVDHHSEFLDWSGFKSYPLPLQRPHPPVVIGGDSDAALRRVVAHGDGWFAPGGGLQRLRPRLQRLRALAEAAGRDPADIEVSVLWNFAREGAIAVSQYGALRVSRLIVPLQALGERDPMTGLDRLAEAMRTVEG